MSASQPDLLRPPLLADGCRIRVVAPSGVVDRARLEAGLAWIREQGWEPCFDDGVFADAGYLGGTDERRVGELQAALQEPATGAIWVARGGYGATRLLGHLDLAAIARDPKWLVGFSDATALHAAWSRAGIASLHGPDVSTLGRWTETGRDALRAWLERGRGEALPGRLVRGRPGATGRLVGGNLTVLAAMAGTGHLPSAAGCLVLLEDLDEDPYRLDRSTTQLRQAGFLEDAAGIVVGQLTNSGGTYDEALAAILDGIGGVDVPVLAHVPVGHEDASRPLPLGVGGRVEASLLHVLDDEASP